MTREEKIELIERERDGWQNDADDHKRRGCVAHYEHEQAMADVLTEAMTALRGSQPDPDTGLMPCGCGGKVKVECYPGWVEMPKAYQVDCFSCHVGTRPMQTEEQVRVAWNKSRGYPDA